MTKESIADIEERIEQLKVSVANRRRKENKNEKGRETELRIGDKVAITNNLRTGQERQGTIIRVKEDTDRVTVKGRSRGGKVVRSFKNVRRIEEFS